MLHATIIAKEPVPGKVKTRLCPPLSPPQAATVAAAALLETIEVVLPIAQRFGARPTLLFDGTPPSWIPSEFEVVPQRGEGLGERLAHGFCDLGPGVIVGMETPHRATGMGPALQAVGIDLDTIAMATDGGYWLIGLGTTSARNALGVFAGVQMSTSSTGLAQLRRLHALGRPVRVLEGARDLDTFDDLVSIVDSKRVGRLAEAARHAVEAVR